MLCPYKIRKIKGMSSKKIGGFAIGTGLCACPCKSKNVNVVIPAQAGISVKSVKEPSAFAKASARQVGDIIIMGRR